MRKETKIGIIIGIIIVAGVAVYFANQEKPDVPAIPDNISLDDVDNSKSQTELESEAELTEKVSESTSTAIEINLEADSDTIEDTTSSLTDLNEIANTSEEINDDSMPDPRDEVAISLPTETEKIVETDTPTASVESDPLANLPTSYPEQTTEVKYHTVQKGDSLYSISTQYFGTGKYWKRIYETNQDVIKNESALSIGWKLRIPTPEEIE